MLHAEGYPAHAVVHRLLLPILIIQVVMFLLWILVFEWQQKPKHEYELQIIHKYLEYSFPALVCTGWLGYNIERSSMEYF